MSMKQLGDGMPRVRSREPKLRSRPDEAPPELERAFEVIERNARAQARMIEDVLDIARVVSGKRLELPVGVEALPETKGDPERPKLVSSGVVLPVHAREEEGGEPPDARDAKRGPGRDEPRLDGLKVLVVDDDEDARQLLDEILSGRGACVVVSPSASDALAQVQRFLPDVLVSDIAMPGGDGYGLIRAVRALPAERGGRTPAVAVTAHARPEDRERAVAAGFQRHLTKPVEIGRLVATVANLGGISFDAAREAG